MLGKYLSPRLYVAYGVGLFDPVSTFRIRYLLSRRWTLEAETGVGTSADVLYTLERGGGTKRDAPDDGWRDGSCGRKLAAYLEPSVTALIAGGGGKTRISE